jgi:hypothetical protein
MVKRNPALTDYMTQKSTLLSIQNMKKEAAKRWDSYVNDPKRDMLREAMKTNVNYYMCKGWNEDEPAPSMPVTTLPAFDQAKGQKDKYKRYLCELPSSRNPFAMKYFKEGDCCSPNNDEEWSTPDPGEGVAPFCCSICGEAACLPVPPSIFRSRKRPKLHQNVIKAIKKHCVEARHALSCQEESKHTRQCSCHHIML